MDLYKDPAVQKLLGKFLSGEIEAFNPVYDSNCGYIYPPVNGVSRKTSKVEEFLFRLVDAGILERELYDKILSCPNCGSPKISIHYNCPHCESFNISKSALIEHLKCGYIDTEEHFKSGSKLACPKCNQELAKPDFDHRRAGIWCMCNDCHKNFDIPVPSHFCRSCHTNFTFEDAVYEEVYSYRLSEEAKQEASLGWTLVTPIKELLEMEEFKVETPGFLKGKSGAKHMFDVAATRKDDSKQVTVIDLVTSNGAIVSEQSVVAMFAKVYDATPQNAYLIAIPKITESGKKMAKLYSIKLIEAEDLKEATKALKSVLAYPSQPA